MPGAWMLQRPQLAGEHGRAEAPEVAADDDAALSRRSVTVQVRPAPPSSSSWWTSTLSRPAAPERDGRNAIEQ